MAKRRRKSKKNWSVKMGNRATRTRGSSLVRAYERPDRPGVICITKAWETTPSGRPREETLDPGTTRGEAEILVHELVAAREREIISGAHGICGREEVLVVRDLLTQYHSHKIDVGKWSPRHAREQARCRDSWIMDLSRALGSPVPVSEITCALVEKLATERGRESGWGGRSHERHIRYLQSAFHWAWRKARIIDHDPLLGVECPAYDSDTSGLVYSTEEVRRLATPHPEVDWRVTLTANLAWEHGRRVGAISNIRTRNRSAGVGSDLRYTEGGWLMVRYGWATDKAKRGKWLPVSLGTQRLIEKALEHPDVIRTGYLIPRELTNRAATIHHLESSDLITLLRDAEELLGIPYVAGRGFHGIKRRHVTVALKVSRRDLDLVGDVTGNQDRDILLEIYREEEEGPEMEHVRAMHRQIGGNEPVPTSLDVAAGTP